MYGNTRAMRAHERSVEDQCSPDLTDGDTATDGSTTNYDTKDDEALKNEMRLTFAEMRIIDLKRDLVAEYRRAEIEKERATKAEEALALADPDELKASRQQMIQAIKEKEAALVTRDKATMDTEQAKMETDRVREAFLKSRRDSKKLAADLEDARTARSSQHMTALEQLRTMIADRDAKIEQLVDKNDRLTAEHFATLETNKKVETDTSFYKSLSENQKYDLTELRSKLTLSQRENVRCVHPAFLPSLPHCGCHALVT
jgi:chromosome segregation protein